MIVNGFCKEVFRELPMEFAVEAGKLLESAWKVLLDEPTQRNGPTRKRCY